MPPPLRRSGRSSGPVDAIQPSPLAARAVRAPECHALTTDRTESSPLFQKSAEDLLQRLENDTSTAGKALCEEARQLVAVFRGWGQTRPDATSRLATINRLFDLNRRVLDFLARTPPSSRRT